jgi:endoglucanase
MRKLWVASLLLSFGTGAYANPMWHADGQRLVDGHGTPVHMRGVNLGNWLLWEGWMFGGSHISESKIYERLGEALGPEKAAEFRARYYDAYITEADIAAIAAAGFNTIRLPINARLLTGHGAGFGYIDRLLRWAHAHGLHVILELHAVPGGQSSTPPADPPPGGAMFWTDETDRAALVAIWSALATRYRDSETVAGYDLINEPNAPGAATLLDVYRRLIAAVRAADPQHTIWLEGNKLAFVLSIFATPLGENIGYSAHIYTAYFSLRGVEYDADARDAKTRGLFHFDRRVQQLRNASEVSARLNAPIWIGEFGEDNLDTLATTVGMMNKAAGVIGWTFWTWKRAPAPHPGLCVFALPFAWSKVVGWLTGAPSAARPHPADVAAGAEAFLKAVSFDRCTIDRRVIGALMDTP